MDAVEEMLEDRKSVVSVVKCGGPLQSAPIEMWVSLDEVGIRMALGDFVRGLAAEIGNPTLLLTTAQLEKRIRTAAGTLVQRMKDETVKLHD